MKIDHLLSSAGSRPLKEFPWCQGALEVVNSELTHDQKITENSTGVEVHTLIRTLSSAAIIRLLTTRLHPEDGTINQSPFVTNEHPTVLFAAQCPVPPVTPEIKPKTSIVEKITVAKAALPLFIGLSIVVIGLLLASVTSYTVIKTGNVPDGSTLGGIAQIMHEMGSVYRDSDKSSADDSPKDPEPTAPTPEPHMLPPSQYPTDEEQPEPLLSTE